MNLWKKNKLRRHIQMLVLMFLSSLLVVISSQVIVAKSLIPVDKSKFFQSSISTTYHLSQNFLELNFGSDYYSKLLEADRFYKQGNIVKVKQIQKAVKPDFPPAEVVPAPQADISQLNATGQQYWQTANQAIKENPAEEEQINNRIFEPLESLVAEYPSFVPGHILLANTYELYDDKEAALSTIETASSMYPGRDDVLDAKVALLLACDQPLEASIAAREFAYSYPDYHKTPAYKQAADKYFLEYQNSVKSKLKKTGIISGVGQATVGNESEGLALGTMLYEGDENSVGTALAEDLKSQSNVVTNPQQLAYVKDIGQKLAELMGRTDFIYEFNIIEDPSPNAAAYPGGKIFIHTGMLQLIDSEAELAGILSHEIAHAVLSHGYTGIAETALTSAGGGIASGLLSDVLGVDQKITNTATNFGGVLLNKEFSRDKEEQADVLGLRVLDAAGYSADGLYNVMAKLSQLEGESDWAESLLASHPASEERMLYLEELIQSKGYNRYGYEGVEAYRQIFPS